MGSDRHYAEEAPVRRMVVVAFWMDRFRSQTNGSGGSPMRPATSPWPSVRRTLRTTLPTKPDLLVPQSPRVCSSSPWHPADLSNHYNSWTYMWLRRTGDIREDPASTIRGL